MKHNIELKKALTTVEGLINKAAKTVPKSKTQEDENIRLDMRGRRMQEQNKDLAEKAGDALQAKVAENSGAVIDFAKAE